MNIEKPYVGKYVTAESASEYIDINEITSSLDKINELGSNLTTIANELSSLGSNLNEKVLSVDGSYINFINEKLNIFSRITSNIESDAESYRTSSIEAYNKKQVELNNIAMEKDIELQNANNS